MLTMLLHTLAQATTTPIPLDAVEATKQVMSLAGFAGILALLVNVAKYFGAIKDGKAGLVTVVLNLVLTAGLLLAQQYLPAFNLGQWNQVAGDIANAGAILFGLFLQFGSSLLTHQIATNMKLPVVGASHADGTTKGMSAPKPPAPPAK